MDDLLHLQNIPNQMLSGVSGEALEFINRESSDRYLLELDNNFLSNLNDLCNELPKLTKEQLEELDNIEQSSIPKSTSSQTKQHITKFKNFLKEEGLSVDLNNVPNAYLNNYLRLFYAKKKTVLFSHLHHW